MKVERPRGADGGTAHRGRTGVRGAPGSAPSPQDLGKKSGVGRLVRLLTPTAVPAPPRTPAG